MLQQASIEQRSRIEQYSREYKRVEYDKVVQDRIEQNRKKKSEWNIQIFPHYINSYRFEKIYKRALNRIPKIEIINYQLRKNKIS